MRQALAGLLWGKQYYDYDVHRWLREHGVTRGPTPRPAVRNVPWFHMARGDVISMPDKWEYPWFAAWDLAFHCARWRWSTSTSPRSRSSCCSARATSTRTGRSRRTSGTSATSTRRCTRGRRCSCTSARPRSAGRATARSWSTFHRLLTNFAWWVNRKDPDGRNLFQGGFLGLDNIGVFDRTAPLPGGGTLEQADGTAWMALYCQ